MIARLTVGTLIVAATITVAAQTSVPSSPLSADAHLALEKRCGTPKSASPESIAALRHARWVPFLHLDHIYYEGQVEIAGIEIPRTRKSMMASDHLPFLAELKVGFE